ncbi:SCP-like protein [Cooperia oncophora]
MNGTHMDDTTRYKILQYHDGTRFTLALGESPSKDGFHPPAKNLFKMRWNCTLERRARQQAVGCPKTVQGAPKNGKNIYHGRLTEDSKIGKYNFLSDAVDEWLKLSDKRPMGGNATFIDPQLYSFANMVYQKIYEVGCHYEQCGSGSRANATLLCIYNTKVPMRAKLYEIGVRDNSANHTNAGCARDDRVCQHLRTPRPEPVECDNLLCKLPYKVQKGFL